MDKHVICFNGGSSSIKVAVKKVEGTEVESVVDFNCQGLGTPKGYIDIKTGGEKEKLEMPMDDHKSALHEITEIIDERFPGLNIVAAGHRCVHGGPAIKDTVLIDGPDGKIAGYLKEYSSLAPLHNPANLQIVQAALADPVFGKVPNAGIFDTQFHARMPEYARYYGVPRSWIKDYNIMRYGFHGASYTFITKRFAELNKLSDTDNNIVVAHLGNGCSMAKVAGGIGADTTMGTTPLEGLVMGTRSGDVDPGVLELMADNLNTDIKEIVRILNKESGLYGLYSKDGIKEMHFIRQAALEGDKEAELVVEIAAYRVAKYFCSYLGTMDSPKGIVFTGGIGENEGYFRSKVLNFMKLYKWKIDETANGTRSEECIIAESGTIPGLKAWVIPTDEEKVFALEAMRFA
ncbi:MAG: acetate/propionate family kinase [Spirochaetales bacterium]|uniref:Acetate kinase n=1 Tax=Candidatus Thalassospirochaeta sargassi TaxID=3119039 RepID=A0AAJ1MLH8_9SPIO|nr:acetate/propionate family kinase [Spirochaetales bacterium]